VSARAARSLAFIALAFASAHGSAAPENFPVSSFAKANQTVRTVCMAAFMPVKSQTIDGPIMSEARDYVAVAPLKIRIGSESATVNFQHGATLALDAKTMRRGRWLLELWQNNVRKLSFWLAQADYDGNSVCLWHKPLYGTISVLARPDVRCRCPKV
jgi:hypothetical protein